MELKAFEECEVSPKHKIAIHKDVFVFACYTGGLRISDICRLKWLHFNGTHIIIDTYKTNSTQKNNTKLFRIKLILILNYS